jgi:Fe-S cluster assembly ATP-binding protein
MPDEVVNGEPVLLIDDLRAGTPGGPILQGVSLSVAPGQLHVLMGPNGSGKSTLAKTLLANPTYEVISGRIVLKGEDITELPTEERAQRGLFLGFQHPEEFAGVTVLNFLRQAMSARKGFDMSVLEVRLALMDWMNRLSVDPNFMDRYLNDGFSGGEKKRSEVLQLALLEPDMAILDETDSGLDIDALKIVADGINEVRRERRAAHHALPADPALPHAGRRTYLCRWAHHRVGRPGTRRAPGERGLRSPPGG